MEAIYIPKRYGATEHHNIKDYFKKYTSELYGCQKMCIPDLNETIFNFMEDKSLDVTKKDMIVKSCSVDLLTVPDEKQPLNMKMLKHTNEACLRKMYERYNITDDALRLRTVAEAEARRNKRLYWVNKLIAGSGISMLKTPNISADSIDQNLKPGCGIIIYIRLFRPGPYPSRAYTPNILNFDYEIAILGSNTMADLRDAIKCPRDLIVSTDFSECPDNYFKAPSAKDVYPSGFIYIDGVFYNDFRNPIAIDYSEVIIKWAKEKNITGFTTSDVNVRIDSLEPRFNYPYVYQHQGGCEHLFMFSHARLTNSDDVLDTSAYPFYSNTGLKKTKSCSLCAIKAADWLIYGSDRIPSITLLCNDCCSSYNYVDGKKVGNFNAYPYTNRSALF